MGLGYSIIHGTRKKTGEYCLRQEGAVILAAGLREGKAVLAAGSREGSIVLAVPLRAGTIVLVGWLESSYHCTGSLLE